MLNCSNAVSAAWESSLAYLVLISSILLFPVSASTTPDRKSLGEALLRI